MRTLFSTRFVKQNFHLFFLLIFSSIPLLSCQKKDALKADSDFVSEAKNWFSTNVLSSENRMLAKPFSELPKLAPARVTARMNKLSKRLDWSKAITKSAGELEYVLIPLLNDNLKLKDDYFLKRVFVFYKNTGSPMQMQVIELLTKEQPITDPLQSAAVFFERKMKATALPAQKQDVQVFFYNQKYNSLDAYEINNSQWQRQSSKCLNRYGGDGLSIAFRHGQCERWGMYLVYYDEDGNETEAILLYTYLVGDCLNHDDPAEEQPDEGGGGGEECSMSCDDAEDALDSWNTTTFKSGKFSSGAETGPDANGIIRKPVVIEGDGVVNNYPWGYSEKHALFFTGVIYKTTTNSQWKWESLQYSEIKSVSGSPGPCLSSNVTSSVAGPVISSDKLTATYSASVTTTVTIQCLLGYRTRPNTVPLGNTYTASQYQ